MCSKYAEGIRQRLAVTPPPGLDAMQVVRLRRAFGRDDRRTTK